MPLVPPRSYGLKEVRSFHERIRQPHSHQQSASNSNRWPTVSPGRIQNPCSPKRSGYETTTANIRTTSTTNQPSPMAGDFCHDELTSLPTAVLNHSLYVKRVESNE